MDERTTTKRAFQRLATDLRAAKTAIADLVTRMPIVEALAASLNTRTTNLENTAPPFAGGSWTSGVPTTYRPPVADTDLNGLSITVPSLGATDRFQVVLDMDIANTTSAGGNFIVSLQIDGVKQTQVLVFNTGSTANTGLRTTVCRVWHITGLAAGDHVFKFSATSVSWTNASSVVEPVYSVYGTQTQMTVNKMP